MSRRHPSLDVTSHLIDPARFPKDHVLSWDSIFDSPAPVELEVGSGKGLFLVNSALARPEHNFLGIEISAKYARLAAERAIKRNVPNARLWPADVAPILGVMVPERSLRAVHVYFPDPWWKKRHKKRRVFNESLVRSIVRGLEPAGMLHIATDVEEYYEVIKALVATEPRLLEQPPPEVTEPQHDLDYLTNFERKFRLEGRAIYRASYRRVEVAEETQSGPTSVAAVEAPARLAD